MGDDSNFASTLRQELLAFQERRHTFRLRKLSFVAALFGLGSAHLGELNFAPVLYLVPVVAFLFDIHILAEDYGIKWIGSFLSQEKSSASSAERAWEKWVKDHPGRISPFAAPLVTLLVLGGTAIMLWIGNTDPVLFWIWIFVNLGINVGLVAYWLSLRKRFAEEEPISD